MAMGDPLRSDPLGRDPLGRDPLEGRGRSAGAVPEPNPLGSLAGLVAALEQAQPEAAEHLVAAAHELVLAVKTVVDAAEGALAAQRVALAARAASSDARPEPTPDRASSPTSGVRRIDLA